MATKSLRIGVFVAESVQLLDLSPIDIFGMLDPSYLKACQLPAPLVACGIPSTIHYISTPNAGEQIQLTASAILRISKTTTDPEVQPGMLDIMLIPGADPATDFTKEALDFVRGHAEWRSSDGQATDVLSVCTGCLMLAQSGVLKGNRACGPRGLMAVVKKRFPETEWIDDKRWVVDGNIWSSGAITNGLEMVAAYIKDKFPGPASEVVVAMADIGEKGINYTRSNSRETVWWLWQILKALTVGNDRPKKM